MMLTDDELKEFNDWKRTRDKSEIESVFFELDELYKDLRGYNISMRPIAFKLVVKALLLLRREMHGLVAKD